MRRTIHSSSPRLRVSRRVLAGLALAGAVLPALAFAREAPRPAPSPTAPPPPAAAEPGESLFARRVWPLLAEKCLACHGKDGKTVLGGLDLRTAGSARKGGASGKPAVAAGKPDRSPVYLAVTRRHRGKWSPMPPKESDRLTPEQVALLRSWIAGGAPWPDEARRAELIRDAPWDAAEGQVVRTRGGLSADWTGRRYRPEQLWAFRPLRKPAVPTVRSRKGRVHPIDAFVEARLSALGIRPAPRADRRTLIRRVTFDLTGLPPTPEQIDAFVNDRSPDAWEKVVERLLASPHYGERWGRHWLDVVRYADSSGFANDYERGNAWRYRDYVIRSFNEDRPYDRFIREQIAGDEIAPEDPEMRVAVGFLRMGPWELTGMEVPKIARQRFLDDVTDSVGQVFLGQALQCARCHDHKLDPVPTSDYYAIQAAFATTQLAEPEAPFLKAENRAGFEERQLLEKRRGDYLAALRRLDEKSLAAAGAWLAEKGIDPARWEKTVAGLRAARGGGRERTLFNEARNALLRQGVPEAEIPPHHLGFTPAEFGVERVARKGLERLRWELERYEPYALSVYSGRTPVLRSVNAPLRVPPDRMTAGELEQTAVLAGGDPFSPTTPVQPGVLSAVESLAGHGGQIPEAVEGRRRALAEWIASPRNPLTARVMVNRIWQYHFGQPLAGSPNNFGATGKKPTHPELLDWLASYFVAGAGGRGPGAGGNSGARGRGTGAGENNPGKPGRHPERNAEPAPRPGDVTHAGPAQPQSPGPRLLTPGPQTAWSIKKMHRLIVTSEAYRRSTRHPDPEALARRDPNGTSYAVFRPRRLTAEELRDSMLALSVELNRQVGGVPARPEIHPEAALQPRQVMGTFAGAWEPAPRPEARHRRSIYVLKLRGLRDPFLEVFNEPSPDLSCEAREASTVTPQVFSLFNGQSAHDRALALAARLRKEGGAREAVLRRAFRLLFGRGPDAGELRDTLAHWEAMTARHRTLTFAPPVYPKQVEREAVEENTGERFTFIERLHAYEAFVPDLKPSDVDAETRALADVCLVLFNANEFVYVY